MNSARGMTEVRLRIGKAEARHQLVAVRQGLGKVVAGIDEQDRRFRRDLEQHVRDHHALVLERHGENGVRCEPGRRPSEDFFRGGVLEELVLPGEVEGGIALGIRWRHALRLAQAPSPGNS